MCASAWIFERFSQAVSWWCPLDSALYSFDRGTVVRKKNQVEHRLHGCMNFCANRGLTCKMYGDSAAKVNSHQFSVRPPERASAWIFKRFSQTVSCWCPLQSAFAAESDLYYFRRKIQITVNSELKKQSLEFFLYQKKWVRFSEFSCAHASDQRISKKMDLTHSLTHNAMSKIAHNH